MDDNRYLTRINWEFNNYHKFAKCYCESKNYYLGQYDGNNHLAEEDSYKIKYYNSPQFEKTVQEKGQSKKHCENCVCHHLEYFEPGTLVDVFLSDGTRFLRIYFLYFDSQNCCGNFLQIEGNRLPVIIDCRKIEAIRKSCTAK